jgi:hypothetical protein
LHLNSLAASLGRCLPEASHVCAEAPENQYFSCPWNDEMVLDVMEKSHWFNQFVFLSLLALWSHGGPFGILTSKWAFW